MILNTNYDDIDVKLHVRRIGVKNHEIMRRVMFTNEEGYSLETCDYKVEHEGTEDVGYGSCKRGKGYLKRKLKP